MPNAEQIRKAKERREARANAKVAHEQAAAVQDQVLSAKSQAQAEGNDEARKPLKAVKPRKEAIAEAKAAAEKQADIDAAKVATPVDTETVLQRAAREGRALTLHELNSLAQKADENIREDAVVIAQAAGKAAHDAAIGRQELRGGPHDRHATGQAALDALAAAQKARDDANRGRT